MKNLMMWKERGYEGAPSVKTLIGKPSKHKDLILKYLTEHGVFRDASTGYGKDLITGDIISGTCEGMDDGEYAWMSTLPYYVEKYNISLPETFVKKVIETYGQ